MTLIRPVQAKDIDALYELSKKANFGLTSLPKDRNFLEERIYESELSFSKRIHEPGAEFYFFVLEDTVSGCILGSAGIRARIGGYEPFYTYRRNTLIHSSVTLNTENKIEVLHLEANHDGPTEIGSLFLDPAIRGSGLGKLLSLSRFVFIASCRERFQNEIIAEMRGVSDETGRSPFWDSLGIHFFSIDFPRADYLSIKNKRFIAELMPAYPVYVCLLSKEAREVIGKVHRNTAGALAILLKEGFKKNDRIDIFDGGPMIYGLTDSIRSVRHTQVARIKDITNPIVEQITENEPKHFMIASKSGSNIIQDFRLIQTHGFIHSNKKGKDNSTEIEISEAAARKLKVKKGDNVYLCL